jgi:hypothetical protein
MEEASMHINCPEFKAIICALRAWLPHIQGLQVMVAMDKISVVSYINKQGALTPIPCICSRRSYSSGYRPMRYHSRHNIFLAGST